MAEPTPDETLIAYLKSNALYAPLAQAAGIAKDATVADVHIPGSIKKPKVSTVDEAKAEEVAKRATAGGDVVFAKGQANLYVKRPLTPGSAERLHDWAVEQGIKNIVPPELMHSTQVHSTAEVDTDKLKPLLTLLDIGDGRWLSHLGTGNALVMFFLSQEMQDRHKEALAAGASWDFPQFMPHITISYDTENVDAHQYGMDAPPDFPLQLGPEVFEASNDNWVEENALAKSDDFEMVMKVASVDDDQHIIGGWASVSTVNGEVVVDKQGDVIPIEELEKAFHEYVLTSREHGDMHTSVGSGDLIACLTFTKEKTVLGLVAKNDRGEALEGTWVEYRISDMAVWARIKKGELPEFSIGGRATPYSV